ncbi:MAG: PEP-CTERM sorting domain-containing protein [Myxococcota bacterium]|nr:PEP-CTERM sorting domain-containing protein [Myxococcota bacterium]
MRIDFRLRAILAGCLFSGALSGALLASGATAATLTFELDFEFSGATEPAGTAPWVTLTFDDSVGTANDVRLTIANVGITGSEFVSGVYVNFNTALDPTALTITAVDDSASSPSISQGTNAFKADGDGFFDVLFDFPPPPGSGSAKFTAGESVVFDFSFPSPIDVSDFDFDSAPGGGNGSYRAAAHVQGIGSESGWIGNASGVPEPATGVLLLLAACALRLRRG